MAFVVYVGPHDAVEVQLPGATDMVSVERDSDVSALQCDDVTAANLVDGGAWRYRAEDKKSAPADGSKNKDDA